MHGCGDTTLIVAGDFNDRCAVWNDFLAVVNALGLTIHATLPNATDRVQLNGTVQFSEGQASIFTFPEDGRARLNLAVADLRAMQLFREAAAERWRIIE